MQISKTVNQLSFVRYILDKINYVSCCALFVAMKECENMIADATFMSAVRDLRFDLAVVHGFRFSHCLFLIPHIHDIPYVSDFTSLDPVASRNPSFPSFVPAPVMLVSDKMSFTERLHNFITWINFYSPLFSYAQFGPMSDCSMIEEHKRDPTIKSWQDLSSRSLLFLVNRGHLLEYPDATMPNVIHLEGLTVSPTKPLPSDLLHLVSNAKQGVVVVSFGSGISSIVKKKADAMLAAFSQRKLRSYLSGEPN